MADEMEGVVTEVDQVNTQEAIKSNFALLERAVTQFDSRFTLRALRSISSLRKKLTARSLCEAIVSTYAPGNPTAKVLINATGISQQEAKNIFNDADKKEKASPNASDPKQKKEPIPEIDIYLAVLIQVSRYSLHLLPPHHQLTSSRFSCTIPRNMTEGHPSRQCS
jgi:26S proteasome regulatory subunit N3